MAKPKTRYSKKGNGIKWKTLRHKGPQFYPPYKRLGVQLFKYGNAIVKLRKPSEEVAVMYAKYLLRPNRPRKGQQVLQRNFFQDWRDKYMSAAERNRIQEFSLCDFSLLVDYLKRLSQTKKTMSKRQKEKEKERKEQLKQKFQYVFIDNRKEQISNFMVEPPGLYIGRGDNKNIGRIKDRIQPEDVTINCSCRPPPPTGTRWKEIIHDRTKSWLACYKDSITGKMKYIFPHVSSQIKNQSDREKYAKAEELKLQINRIRRQYQRHLKSKSLEERQLATAVYFLDKLAIRVGNEKHEVEADTVGCCTLRVEHVRLLRPANLRKIELHFLGKDSVPYDRPEVVTHIVYENLREFINGKQKNELVFDEITSTSLNAYLTNMMDGLTAKVFRTFKATQCYETNLVVFYKMLPEEISIKQLRMVHLKANLEVAKLLNHKILTSTNKKAKEKALLKLKDKVKQIQAELRGKERKRPRRGSEEFEEIAEDKRKLQTLEDEIFMKKAKAAWALGTSLANYINPKVVKRWCDSVDLDIKQVYTKTLRDKYSWALEGRFRARAPRQNVKQNRYVIC